MQRLRPSRNRSQRLEGANYKVHKNEEESDDKAATERVARQSAHYTIIGGLLYRRGAGGVLTKCIHSTTGRQLLDEIHVGQCGVHVASRTLMGRLLDLGFTDRLQRMISTS